MKKQKGAVSTVKEKGAIAWMANNIVASNLLMFILIVGGIIIGSRVTQEVFPEFELDIVTVTVPYPGASPSEVEQGIILAVEEAVRGLDGIKRVTSNANEGFGSVAIELMLRANQNKALQDIKNAVDRITSFPQDAERPQVSLVTNRRQVISLVLYGEAGERNLRLLAEQVREDLLQDPGITFVELQGVRPLEISIEVPQNKLREYNLTLPQIAFEVSRSAVELPAGGVKTPGGEVLLRTMERRDFGSQFRDIPLISLPGGGSLQLGEIAEIKDSFRETDQEAFFDGKPAVKVAVFRLGEQTPIYIAGKVKEYAAELRQRLPEGMGAALWEDAAEIYQDRVELLTRNAAIGLIFVLFILGLFLDIRLAFWVTMGIPISVLGALIILPWFNVSINMISLFAFILTLGIVVDDAIVVGENIFEYRQRGLPFMQAAIHGAREVAVPVTFSILTNLAAFIPLFVVPGNSGKFFWQIPAVVVAVLIISLIESLFVLPAHLAHQSDKPYKGIFLLLSKGQKAFSRLLEWVIQTLYRPALQFCVANRYLTLAIGLAVLLSVLGFVIGEHIEFTYLPKVDTDVVFANLTMPYGTPVEETRRVQQRLLEAAQQVLDRHGGERITRGIFTQIGNMAFGFAGGASSTGGHIANVQVFMVPSDQRPISATQMAKEWGDELGRIPGIESLNFVYSTGPSTGSPIDIELSHPDMSVLEVAAAEVAQGLENYAGVRDIDDGFEMGKVQFNLKVKPEARSLGITAEDLARQVRGAFYGARAIRQQRGRDEVWIMVRLPEEERRSQYFIEHLRVRTPLGGEIPLFEAADVEMGRAYTVIKRRDGRRVVNVTADVVEDVANAQKVLDDVQVSVLPGILEKYPRMQFSLEGEQREQRDTLDSLQRSFIFALFVIYALLAIPFKSYVQPAIVMAAIPFGIVGAVGGHLLLGYNLSMVSLMGLVALTGVVVNDSLVLIDAANRYRREGREPLAAILDAGVRRFRPILLTSLTTFFGLAPMIMETSVQARFLIPMAISLGFGVLFSTIIALLLVPSLYMMVEDVVWAFTFWKKPQQENATQEVIAI